MDLPTYAPQLSCLDNHSININDAIVEEDGIKLKEITQILEGI